MSVTGFQIKSMDRGLGEPWLCVITPMSSTHICCSVLSRSDGHQQVSFPGASRRLRLGRDAVYHHLQQPHREAAVRRLRQLHDQVGAIYWLYPAMLRYLVNDSDEFWTDVCPANFYVNFFNWCSFKEWLIISNNWNTLEPRFTVTSLARSPL